MGEENPTIKQEQPEIASNNEWKRGRISAGQNKEGRLLQKRSEQSATKRAEDKNAYNEEEGLRKKRTNEEPAPKAAQNPYRSKRKAKPQVSCPHLEHHNADERLALSEQSFRECQAATKKTVKKNPNNMAHITAWVHHEFFYANYERPYFEENDFKELLECVGVRGGSPLPFGDFKLLQRAMGKPKLFTPAFVHEERANLEDTKDIARQYSKTKNVFRCLFRSKS